MDLNGKTVLVTGATGSFGNEFLRTVLDRYEVEAIRVFSRDELKQSELELKFNDDRLRLLLGDVRDRDRLRVATRGVDVIIHAARSSRCRRASTTRSRRCRPTCSARRTSWPRRSTTMCR